MQPLNNISDRQTITFGNAENSHLWHFQNTDNQYRYNCKITPNSTGKELDTETGFSYFGARYLDHTLTTTWLSVDPMADKYPSISPYAYCAWNPIKLVDPNGDTLDIRGGDQARADILSIVDPLYQKCISFQNDRVIVNTTGLSEEEIEMDAGLSVLYRMTKSINHYLYQAEEVLDEKKEPIALCCNSITPRESYFKESRENLPDGYQGWVVFHPNTVFNGYEGGEYVSNRPSTVFHELEECYQRTDGKLPYMYRKPTNYSIEDASRLGAHRMAIQKAERLTPSARSVFGTEGVVYSYKIVK